LLDRKARSRIRARAGFFFFRLRHLEKFCVYIGEGCEILARNTYNYGKGGTLWQKKLYIRLGKESCRIMRNFDLKNVITTVEGPDTFEIFL
jgi:hypothetical protein